MKQHGQHDHTDTRGGASEELSDGGGAVEPCDEEMHNLGGLGSSEEFDDDEAEGCEWREG